MKYRNLSTTIGIASGSLFSVLFVNSAFGDSGIYESYIVLDLGSGSTYYDLSASTALPNFSGANLGTFNATGANSSILFKGGEVKTFKNGGSNVTGAEVDYRVRLGAGSGAFTVNALNFGADIGGGNQRWDKLDYSKQLISSGMSVGVYSLDAYAKASTSDGDRFANNSGSDYTATFTIQATDYTWSGGGGTGATGTSTNWVGGVTPGQGHNLIFNNTNNSQVSITNAFTTINALTFSAGTTSAFTISGTAFTLGNGAGLTGITATSGITNSGSATQTVNAALTLGNAVTFGASGGSITLGGSTLNLGTNRLTVTGASNTVISNLVSSTSTDGKIVKEGTGTLILSGANTYSGNTEINTGTVRVDANPGNATSNYFVGNGGTTTTAATLLLGGANGTGGGVTLANSITINPGSGNNRTLGGENITGTTNTFSGPIVTNGGNLTITSTNSGANLAFNNATALDLKVQNLLINGSGNIQISGAIINSTGSGSVTKQGSGTATFSSSGNTYSGGTTVSVGTLLANNTSGSATGSGTVAVSGATLGGSGTISGGTTLTTATLAPGSAAATVGILTFGAGLALNSTSIFEWDMQQVATTDPGAAPAPGGTNAGAYDRVVLNGAANSLTGTGAIFKIVLGSGKTFANAFWDTNKTWNNVFTGNGVAGINLATIFNTFNVNGSNLTGGLVAGEGTFTLNGSSTLNWTAVPEPSSALAGLLLATGLLRRRRA